MNTHLDVEEKVEELLKTERFAVMLERYTEKYSELVAASMIDDIAKDLVKALTEMKEAGAKRCQISKFKCSEHGKITPRPICPKCLPTTERSTYEWNDKVHNIAKKVGDDIREREREEEKSH